MRSNPSSPSASGDHSNLLISPLSSPFLSSPETPGVTEIGFSTKPSPRLSHFLRGEVLTGFGSVRRKSFVYQGEPDYARGDDDDEPSPTTPVAPLTPQEHGDAGSIRASLPSSSPDLALDGSMPPPQGKALADVAAAVVAPLVGSLPSSPETAGIPVESSSGSGSGSGVGATRTGSLRHNKYLTGLQKITKLAKPRASMSALSEAAGASTSTKPARRMSDAEIAPRRVNQKKGSGGSEDLSTRPRRKLVKAAGEVIRPGVGSVPSSPTVGASESGVQRRWFL